MTVALNLDKNARNLLQTLESNLGPIADSVRTDIANRADGQRVTPARLEALLCAAMPNATSQIKQARATSSHHADGKNPDFLTQLIGTHSIKKARSRWVGSTRTRPAGDPLYAKLFVDPSTQAILLLNASRVGDDGRPALMKIIAREDVDVNELDLTGYHGPSARDVHRISNTDATVSIEDVHEGEFNFGDALVYVALDKAGKEQGRGVAVNPMNELTTRTFRREFRTPRRHHDNLVATDVVSGPELDTAAPRMSARRVRFVPPKLRAGAWLDEPVGDGAQLVIDKGLIYEPGSKVGVRLGATTDGGGFEAWAPKLSLSVPKTDAALSGSKAGRVALSSPGTKTLAELLGGTVIFDCSDGRAEASSQAALAGWLFEDLSLSMAGGRTPLSDFPLEPDEVGASLLRSASGVCARLELPEGLVDGLSHSPYGWTLEAGYTDPDGKWVRSKRKKLTKGKSFKTQLDIPIKDPVALIEADTKLELRLYNPDGVPALRGLTPLCDVDWAE